MRLRERSHRLQMSCVRLVCCVELLCKWGLVSSGNLALGHPIPYSLFPSNMPHVLFVCTCAFLAVRPRDVKANGVADRWHRTYHIMFLLNFSRRLQAESCTHHRSVGPTDRFLPSASRCPGGAVCHPSHLPRAADQRAQPPPTVMYPLPCQLMKSSSVGGSLQRPDVGNPIYVR